MANADVIDEDAPPKKGKLGLIIALFLALIAGGGGFFAAFSGMLPLGGSSDENAESSDAVPLKALVHNTYVALDPLVVNIRSSSKYQLLKFVSQLEVKPEHAADIELLKPRLMDVMNTYLNALEAARFEDPIALIKLRAQLLRRLQIITGDGRIEDLLIMEFILQ
ncbi:MAG: flagellar basal body-associated FliL family protein [Planktotalea sp.]|uniref:flagellar basal body-associated FliL family protein n=1 Tax=Planktotalea sp. TaxID=2029877 RepID=UPI003C75A628